jgi:putative oxidoreductase
MRFTKVITIFEPCKQFSQRALLPLGLLAARLLVADDFFKSGLTKLNYVIAGQADTLYFLFEDYHVPLLPLKAAAWMGMGGELVLSTLLALGLLARFGALGLVVMCAVIWHADHNELAPFWAMICTLIALQGPGTYALDHLLFGRRPPPAAGQNDHKPLFYHNRPTGMPTND